MNQIAEEIMGIYENTGEASYKWLPDVDLEKCTGCGMCAQVCTPKSLKIVNDDFAVLVGADTCGSEGHCVDSCPDDAIHMEWIEMSGEHTTGEWKTVMRL
ncbi:MAG TPA: 4Fe-4S binding protein [Thermodesulfobacteriota bacterium]|nr:4Fe-4S binding protein [Thermodesulfobacteriota bacterium]